MPSKVMPLEMGVEGCCRTGSFQPLVEEGGVITLKGTGRVID